MVPYAFIGDNFVDILLECSLIAENTKNVDGFQEHLREWLSVFNFHQNKKKITLMPILTVIAPNMNTVSWGPNKNIMPRISDRAKIVATFCTPRRTIVNSTREAIAIPQISANKCKLSSAKGEKN